MAEDVCPSFVSSNSTTLSHVECTHQGEQRICIVGSLAQDSDCLEAVKHLQVPFSTSATGKELIDNDHFNTYFVLPDFDSQLLEELQDNGADNIIGRPVLLEQSLDGVLPFYSRPVYCNIMRNCVIVFSGFRKKSELARLLKLVHFMGASVKNDMTKKVTHLLACSATGDKYQYAVTFNIPVVDESWVDVSWAHRDDIGSRASDFYAKHKLKVLHNLHIALVGFPEDEREQMEELISKNGGFCTALNDPLCTHVVLEDQSVKEKPAECPSKCHVVKAEWFWASIQMDACANERLYQFEDNENTVTPKVLLFSPGTPSSRSHRRKRLRETVKQLADDDSPSTMQGIPPSSKRRSSVGDLAYLSADGSFLDESVPTPGYLTPSKEAIPMSPPVVDMRQLSKRQRVFHELLKTECSYVSILDTIYKVIKDPLEDPSQPGGPMLDPQELRYIFGHLLPIYDVHTRLRNDLLTLAYHWSEDVCIGNIVLSHCVELEKAYPPFVNYFENVKEMLQKISNERPRFHAFLKIAQNKPECGRQSFQELLIRPVQRLPSMSLLINDILKHTNKESPDHAALQEALDKIRSIVSCINDDKRKTEAKLKLFEIHNEIENCPPNLVASHRTYLSKVDVTELSDSCCGRGDSLTLFLFNDILEICKKKSKYNSLKSPSRANIHALKTIKTYKHLEMVPLAHIKRVVDIRDTEDCHNVFAIIIRSNQELKERLYTFTIPVEDNLKQNFLMSLCRNMASVVCRNDVENFMVSMDPHHLDIETSDVSLTAALTKAIRFATRTGRKVSRAFSFNKSPNKLKRAVSTVMSPFGTLSNQTLRGATSVNNLSDVSSASTPPSSCGPLSSGMITPTPRRKTFLKHP